MSTQVAGEHDRVFAALAEETETTFAGDRAGGVRHEGAGRRPTADER